jgi:hypothetical protein
MYRSNNDSYPSGLANLIPTYIQSIPKDPKTNLDYDFDSLPTGCTGVPADPCNSYSIVANLEGGGTYTAGPY